MMIQPRINNEDEDYGDENENIDGAGDEYADENEDRNVNEAKN